MPVVVGTSGWQYRDWRGLLYPPDLPQRDWLAYYAGQYATVENNSTFYRLPARDTFANWQAKIPADFVMTVKASPYLTHVQRVRGPQERSGTGAARPGRDGGPEPGRAEATVSVSSNNARGGGPAADPGASAAACRRAGRTVPRAPGVPICSPGSPGCPRRGWGRASGR